MDLDLPELPVEFRWKIYKGYYYPRLAIQRRQWYGGWKNVADHIIHNDIYKGSALKVAVDDCLKDFEVSQHYGVYY